MKIILPFLQFKAFRQLLSSGLLIYIALVVTAGLFQSFMPLSAQEFQSEQDNGLAAIVSRFESQVFYSTYERDSIEPRLSRLESSVFGSTQSGDTASRIQALQAVLANYKPLQPLNDDQDANPQNASVEPVANANSLQNQNFQAEPDATDYPTVTALEHEIFARDFLRDPLPARLDRLERKVYGQAYPNMALIDRVDKLLMRYPRAQERASLLASGPSSGYAALPSNSFPSIAPTEIPDDLLQNPLIPNSSAMGSDLYTKIALLEENILGNDQNQQGKLLTERLDLLEKRIFGYAQFGSPATRLDKLLQARNISNSSPSQYQQRQIVSSPITGYNRPYQSRQSSSSTSSPRPRQNIQIGMGVSSQSQHRYSRDLIDMLPNDIRQQLGNGTSSSSSSYTTSSSNLSGNGSVVMTETTEYPGMQLSRNGVQVISPPTQYQNTYTMTPQIISPQNRQPQSLNGQYQVQQQFGTQVISPQPGYSVSYNGNPADLQRLTDMEAKTFGQVNFSDSIDMRLWKLESQVSGQTFGGYSIAERLDNLDKVLRYQNLGQLLDVNNPNQSPSTLGVPLDNGGIPSTPPAQSSGN